MQTASMGLIIRDVLESAQQVERISSYKIPKFFLSIVDHFVVPRIRKASSVASEACFRIKIQIIELNQNTKSDLVDSDLELRDSLEGMKTQVQIARRDMLKNSSEFAKINNGKTRMWTETKTLLSLLAELYEEANQLQWAIAEHDANFGKRLEGFVATNQDELNTILERITTGA
ncbi:MAG: hypothetical protein ABI351_09830 [Herbaspirillum sp.]